MNHDRFMRTAYQPAVAPSGLRELNEVNFARFEAKLEQRIAELEMRINRRIDGLENRLDGRINGLEGVLNARMDRLELTLEKRLGEHVRFFFVAGAALMVPLVAILFQMVRV
jgi:hypothetical protein